MSKVFPTYFSIVQIRRIYINRFFNNISCLCFPSYTDNGGGINPDKMRQCMSLGYSTKSKSTNTIGQCEFSHLNEKYLCDNLAVFIIYCLIIIITMFSSKMLPSFYICFELYLDGNGFKTSTMRLGADVIVFSRCSRKDGERFVALFAIPLSFRFLVLSKGFLR